MKSLPIAVALACAVPVLAQEAKPPEALPHFRAAFAAEHFEGPAIAIAVVGNAEPVILCVGMDRGGQAIGEQSPLPLGSLARVLAADALFVQQKRNLDAATGVSLAGTASKLGELLAGSPLLPDYYAWDRVEQPPTRDLLLRCAEVAAAARVQFRGIGAGMAEMVLLEPLAFGKAFQDWPTMLRATLAAHVPGLDPVDARALTEAAAQRLPELGMAGEPPGGTAAMLANAEPALLRTLVSVKNLGAWWQWRVQQDLPRWEGLRMGRKGSVTGQADGERWTFLADTLHYPLQGHIYPGRKAGVLLFTANRRLRLNLVQAALEEDLFGAAEGAGANRLVAGFAGAARAAAGVALGGVQPGQELVGTRWRSAVRPDGSVACRLFIESLLKDGVKLERSGEVLTSAVVNVTESGLDVTTARNVNTGYCRLILLPKREQDAVIGMTMVLVEERLRLWSLPQVFELLPEAK